MTRDDIIKLAREAGFEEDDDLVLEPEVIWYISQPQLERFAALVAAAEREACAKACENTEFDSDADFYRPDFAAAIRARGQA